jgi:nucleoside-diphosphate-sugar epimerase
VCLRYFNVFGPRQDPGSPYAAVIPIFISKLVGGQRPTIFGTGEQTRDFVYVRDVCRANLAALRAPSSVCGRVFNVASETSISVNTLYARIAHLVGRAGTEPVYAAAQPGDVQRTLGSKKLSGKLLGFQPETTLEEGLGQTVRFFSNQAAR